jgi:hypothetical protein
VAILATLLALGSRFAGKVLTTTLGWAGTLLFGRVPASRQYGVLAITFGSVIWLVLLLGIAVPDVGAFLLLLVPPQQFVPESAIRLAMLIGALIVPALVGGLVLWLSPPVSRHGRAAVVTVLRGYPLTALLAVLLIFLAGLAVWRRARSFARRWTDAHVPMVVKAGSYDAVAADLDTALSAAGLDVAPRPAPAAMSMPARWLAAVAGGAGDLVPDHLVQLHGPALDILVYPSDLLISGRPRDVARARAAMASRLVTAAAYLTTTTEGQAIEDRLATLARPPDADSRPPRFDDRARAELEAIDGQLATAPVSYEEWEVLYRQRLQVERDLRARLDVGQSVLGDPLPTGMQPGAAVAAAAAKVGELVQTSAAAVVEVGADEQTAEALDRLAGSRWRWSVRITSIIVAALRVILRGDRDGPGAATRKRSGEPAAFPTAPDQERPPRP